MGVGGEAVAGQLADAGLDVVGIEAELVGGECPVLGMYPQQDDAARRTPARRRAPRPRYGRRHRRRHSRLGAGGRADPQGGHGRLGRHRCRRPVHRQGRPPSSAGGARILDPTGSRSPAAASSRPGAASCSPRAPRPSPPPVAGLPDTPYWTNREAVSTETVPAQPDRPRRRSRRLRARPRPTPASESRSRIVEAAGPADQPMEEPEASRVMAEALEGAAYACSHRRSRLEVSDARGLVPVRGRGARRSGHWRATARRHRAATRCRRGDLARPRARRQPWTAASRRAPPGSRRHLGGRRRDWQGCLHPRGDLSRRHRGRATSSGQDRAAADHHALPRVAFTDPEIGAVGLTEAQALDARLPA